VCFAAAISGTDRVIRAAFDGSAAMGGGEACLFR
jgi:hypothetical protein